MVIELIAFAFLVFAMVCLVREYRIVRRDIQDSREWLQKYYNEEDRWQREFERRCREIDQGK